MTALWFAMGGIMSSFAQAMQNEAIGKQDGEAGSEDEHHLTRRRQAQRGRFLERARARDHRAREHAVVTRTGGGQCGVGMESVMISVRTPPFCDMTL